MPKIQPLALSLSLSILVACSSDKGKDAGADENDGAGGADAGLGDGSMPGVDAEPPDSGPLPCVRDQGGIDSRGCDPGQVCNLTMNPPRCVPGRSCAADVDCNVCSDLRNPQDCGHGYNVVAFCDARHGNVCTRSRAPCEPCNDNRDCGRRDPVLGGAPSQCLDYGNGEKYCGRPCSPDCPKGFTCDATSNQCKADSCDPDTLICPPDNMSGPSCTGTDQICPGESCGTAGGERCSTNDQPGGIGVCISFCVEDGDCPATLPICNRRNGLCISGCTQGSCAGGQVCHSDGFCRAPCTDNADCQTRFGADTYCNTPGQPPPRIFKSYRDTNSCAPLGCEKPVDCGGAGFVCDKLRSPAACVQGCFEDDDCLSGFICKSTGGAPPMTSYTRQQCRGLPAKTNMDEIGVCCNPGCTNRVLQCNINEFCCAEPSSPYEDPASCLTITSTGGPRAEAGQCFEMGAPNPWCAQCMSPEECSSGWTPGYNVDPNINGGQPFQEQEWCTGIAMDLAICTVTCNPTAPDKGCPRGWSCRPFDVPCFQDADCNQLPCIGADTSMNPPRPGRCKCGEGGVATASCPTAYATLPVAVTYPRCIELAGPGANPGDMFCIASYTCEPPNLMVNMSTGDTNFPSMCGF